MSEYDKTTGMLRDRLRSKYSVNNEIFRYEFFSFLLCDAILVTAYTMFNSTQE